MVVTEGLTVRPCSSRMYQSTPMPASSATSSRLRPAVRRLRPPGRPTALGLSFSRRDRRKSPNSLRRGSAMTITPSVRRDTWEGHVGGTLGRDTWEGTSNPRIIPGLPAIGKSAIMIASPESRIIMKAAVLRAFGSPLSIETLPDPVLGTGEIIVDVVATRVLSYANEVFSGERK